MTTYAYQEREGQHIWHLVKYDGENNKIENGKFYTRQLIYRNKAGEEFFEWYEAHDFKRVDESMDDFVPCAVPVEYVNRMAA